jgi:hypothetical protein
MEVTSQRSKQRFSDRTPFYRRLEIHHAITIQRTVINRRLAAGDTEIEINYRSGACLVAPRL